VDKFPKEMRDYLTIPSKKSGFSSYNKVIDGDPSNIDQLVDEEDAIIQVLSF